MTNTLRVGKDEVVALLGYRGDKVVRVVRVEKLSATHLTGQCLLRSSPAEPLYRTYILDKIGGFRPVVGFAPSSEDA